MSKASEWAEAPTFPREDLFWRGQWAEPQAYPVLFSGGRVRCAIMQSHGNGYVSLSREQALDLARWILDTFGDAP